MNKDQAYHGFWSSFGIPAYEESTVLGENNNKPQLPYITYNVSLGSINEEIPMTVSLWYRGTSWKDIANKSQDISNRITMGGVLIPFDNGLIWIKRGVPFSNRMYDEKDTSIRRILINVSAEFISAN